MSASNWDVCPKCLTEATKINDKATAEVYAKYGEVSPEEFDRLRKEIAIIDPEDFRTFREDYEIYGANEGEIQVKYSGECSQCNLGVKLNTSKRFWSLDGESS